MKCPRCQVELARSEMHGVEVEGCSSCGGLWIDEARLERAMENADPDLGWLEFEIFKDDRKFEVDAQGARCPSCERAMVRVAYGEGGVQLDTCPADRAIWFDGAELERLLTSLRDELARMPALAYLKEALEEAIRVARHPESLPVEWEHFKQLLQLVRVRLFVEHSSLYRSFEALQGRTPLS